MAGVNGIEIKVGQVWRTRGGALATVESFDTHPDYPVNLKIDGDAAVCGRNGRCWGDIGAQHISDDDDDLIELVKDAAPQPTDSATLAEETLVALGWTFDGQAWVENAVVDLPISMVPNALDVQVGGTHYKDCAIQPIEYIHANKLGFAEGNVVKYITRHRQKHGADDVRKVIHYCQLLLELEYGAGKAEGGV